MANKKKSTKRPVTITFLIPEDWDVESFVMELAGHAPDAEQVEYFRGPVS